MENENLLKGDLPSFKNEKEEIGYLRDLVAKLRTKCNSSLKDNEDLQREFETER